MRDRFLLTSPFILYAGNIKPHKNVDRLIEAYSILRRRGINDVEAADHRRRDFEIPESPPAGAPVPAASARAVPRASCRTRRSPRCIGSRRCSSSRRSTRVRPAAARGDGRRARRSSRRTCRRCPKWSATRPCSSIRWTPARSPTRWRACSAMPRCSADLVRRGHERVEDVLLGAVRRARARGLRRARWRRRVPPGSASRPPRRARARLAHRHARRREGARVALPHVSRTPTCSRSCTSEGTVSPAIESAPDPHVVRAAPAPARRACIATTCRSFPSAIECFDLDDVDLVVSTSHCAAKSVVPTGRAVHVCYCHSPMRYAWDQFDAYFGRERLGTARPCARPAGAGVAGALGSGHGPSGRPLRRELPFRCGADRPGTIIVGVGASIRRWTSTFFTPGDGPPATYFLVVSALVPYKRIDVAIHAAEPAWRAASRSSAPGPDLAAPAGARRADRSSSSGTSTTTRSGTSTGAPRPWCSRPRKTSASRRSSRSPAAGPSWPSAAAARIETVEDGVTGLLVARADARGVRRRDARA